MFIGYASTFNEQIQITQQAKHYRNTTVEISYFISLVLILLSIPMTLNLLKKVQNDDPKLPSGIPNSNCRSNSKAY